MFSRAASGERRTRVGRGADGRRDPAGVPLGVGAVGVRERVQRVASGAPDGRCAELRRELAHGQHGDVALQLVESGPVLVDRRS